MMPPAILCLVVCGLASAVVASELTTTTWTTLTTTITTETSTSTTTSTTTSPSSTPTANPLVLDYTCDTDSSSPKLTKCLAGLSTLHCKQDDCGVDVVGGGCTTMHKHGNCEYSICGDVSSSLRLDMVNATFAALINGCGDTTDNKVAGQSATEGGTYVKIKRA